MKTKGMSVIGLFILLGSGMFFMMNRTADTIIQSPIRELLKEDSAATFAIAAYPDSIRNAVFLVSRHPEAILKIENLQQYTREEFKKMVAPLDKAAQARIWNISRYDGLAKKLAGGKMLSKEELDKIAVTYPEDVRADIIKSGQEDYNTLFRLDALNTNTGLTFRGIVAGYQQETQKAFDVVLRRPELTELLGSAMRLTVKTGDFAANNPAELRRQFDSLAAVLEEQKTEEVKNWKNGLAKNPQAMEDFTQATKTYETEHAVVCSPVVVTHTVYVSYYCAPYRYWYGYPWWMDNPYWYPYPYWYSCGYYYGSNGIVFFGCPTPYYMTWYFYHYPHHYYYCHFSDFCIGHYYGHRRAPGRSSRVIGNWIAQEQPRVSSSFFNASGRTERLQELGREEIERTTYNLGHPGNTITRESFVNQNADAYPNLRPSAKGEKPVEKQPGEKGTSYPVPQPGQKHTPEIKPVQPKTAPPKQQPRGQQQVPQPKPAPKQTPPPKTKPKQNPK